MSKFDGLRQRKQNVVCKEKKKKKKLGLKRKEKYEEEKKINEKAIGMEMKARGEAMSVDESKHALHFLQLPQCFRLGLNTGDWRGKHWRGEKVLREPR